VLGVVPVGRVLVGREQLESDEPQALALKAGDHLTGEGALEGIGLDE
jgi:hypothetical protein